MEGEFFLFIHGRLYFFKSDGALLSLIATLTKACSLFLLMLIQCYHQQHGVQIARSKINRIGLPSGTKDTSPLYLLQPAQWAQIRSSKSSM